MIRNFLVILLLFLETSLASAQVPTGLSEATVRCLDDFSEAPSAATANLFFSQLLGEEFVTEPIHFDSSVPEDTLCAQVWYWAAEYYYAAQHYAQSEAYALRALPLLQQGGDESPLAD